MHLLSEVDTVLLDMDGTLLDLHYDNHFWLEFVPSQYAQKLQIPLAEAESHVFAQYAKVSGQLDWYCYDHWSKTFGLDIHELQHKTKHKIQVRSDTLWFLERLRQLNKRVVILTNAHRSGIDVKMQETGISRYFDEIVSSHDYQAAKEAPHFWSSVESELKLDLSRCLFIDDSEKILKAAEQAGVAYLCGIATPDSTKAAQNMRDFKVIKLFSELL
ncbi:GMP/IMP nucleotidase [Psychromonas ossibalaenae]|uniref:GMP/IMP nucleotidase n=1 Tax=Psychromonas ossibalaenae TaxID=444922 RepID=UPI00037416A4|nr:GMP/IMP nucleotidase [Psychromonas ossibalaenae]